MDKIPSSGVLGKGDLIVVFKKRRIFGMSSINMTA